MDISLLLSDEIEHELVIRGIVARGDGGLQQLQASLDAEYDKQKAEPLAPSNLRIGSEVRTCRENLETLKVILSSSAQEADESHMAAVRSRLIHLIGRIKRIVQADTESAAARTLLKDATETFQFFVIVRDSLGADETNGRELASQEDGAVGGSAHQYDKDNLIEISQSRSSAAKTNTMAAAAQQNNFNFPNVHVQGFSTEQRSSMPFVNIVTPPLNDQGIIQAIRRFPQYQPSHAQLNQNNPYRDPAEAIPHLFSHHPAQPGQVNFNNQLPPLRQSQPLQQINPFGNGRPSFVHQMAKWNIKFSGSSTDLHVDEFLFRIETLARSAGIEMDALPLGMHYVLHGQAYDWYWIFHREFPNAVWESMKSAIRNQFSAVTDEFELWDLVRSRKQQPHENFGQFYLAVAAIASRFDQPLAESHLVRLLRSNMNHQLKNALLYHPTPSLRALQEAAKQFEKLYTETSVDHSRYRPPVRRVSELDFSDGQLQYQQPTGFPEASTVYETFHDNSGNGSIPMVIEAVADNRIARPSMAPVICWNCDDIGHTFQDCQVATRNVFCYGCGAKNTYRPNCAKCAQGNAKTSGPQPGQFRSNPNVTRQDPNSIMRRPNPFARQ